MAGIGFELQKLIEDRSLFSKIKAYIIATIITSGPWLLSVLGLSIIGILTSSFLKGKSFGLFTITIVYTFAFSLIVTGPIQFELTRYLADKVFLKEEAKMSSALTTASIVVIILSLPLSSFWYIDMNLSTSYKIVAIILFVVMGLIWTLMDFLSCTKRYGAIVFSFFIGILISVILSYFGTIYYKEIGAISGYTIGQIITLALLWKNIFYEYPLKKLWNNEFLKYFIHLPHIALNGLFYNLGLWIDKITYWIFKGETVYDKFKAYSYYDIPLFIAYLSIVPSLAHFLIQGETEFYKKYRNFFDSIKESPLSKIIEYKNEMLSSLKKTIFSLFIIQFSVMLLGEILSQIIWKWLGYPEHMLPMFRKMLFASFLQIMFLYTMIFLMYFDLRDEALITSFLFYFFNHTLTLVFLNFPESYTGLGYIISLIIAVSIGNILLYWKSKKIDLMIFIRQK